jgi:hypothetical protein
MKASGMTVKSSAAKITNVVCQPSWSISAAASGENRNWPKRAGRGAKPERQQTHAGR